MNPIHPLRAAPRPRRSAYDDVVDQARRAIFEARRERDEARQRVSELQTENARLRNASERSRAVPAPTPPSTELRELEAERDAARRQRDTAQSQARRDALAEVAEPLVAIVAHLGRALASNPDPESDWFRGTAAVLARTRSAIERLGLVLVDQVGVGFDPALHDAVGTLETSGLAPDTVADVLEAGLTTTDGTLVRAAKVLVARP